MITSLYPKIGNIFNTKRNLKMDNKKGNNDQPDKKFFVNIEGIEYPWDKETISVAEIRQLGNLPTDQPVIEELPDGTERTLTNTEVIEIKPGHRFGRAPKYKRGNYA